MNTQSPYKWWSILKEWDIIMNTQSPYKWWPILKEWWCLAPGRLSSGTGQVCETVSKENLLSDHYVLDQNILCII